MFHVNSAKNNIAKEILMKEIIIYQIRACDLLNRDIEYFRHYFAFNQCLVIEYQLLWL